MKLRDQVGVESGTLDSPRFSAPLIFAAAHEPKIFRLLLDHGANKNGRDSNGRSLSEYLREAHEEYQKLAKHDDMSGNLMRHIKRNLRALSKSLDILTT